MKFGYKKIITILLILILISCGNNSNKTTPAEAKTKSNEEALVEEAQKEPAEEEVVEEAPAEEEVVEEAPAEEETPAEEAKEEPAEEKTPEQLLEERKNKLDEREKKLDKLEKSAKALMKTAEEKDSSAEERLKEAEATREEAKELLTEEKKKRFEERITFWIRLTAVFVIGFLGFFLHKLYTWRNVLETEHGITLEQLPEQTYTETKDRMIKLGDLFSKLAGFLNDTRERVDHLANKASDNDHKNENRFKELIENFNQMSKNIQEKDVEIERLKEGYNSKTKEGIIKEILIIRDRALYYKEEESTNEETKDMANDLIKVIDTRLDNLNVKKLSFIAGEMFREIEGADVADEDRVKTKNIEEKGKVIETIQVGYYIDGLEGRKFIIRNAKIKCYEG